jgi:SAM-dependent methyltransferase
MRALYEVIYRYFGAPWDIGPRDLLVDLVREDQLKPGRVIDLGCGTGNNSIFLAQHGFEVTGVDYAHAAIAEARERADAAGVAVSFIADDLTDLEHVTGTYDLLVDYGTLDDLVPRDRDRYLENILPLTRENTQMLLYCFEWRFRWWERALFGLAVFGAMAMEPGEVERRFGEHFDIIQIAQHLDYSKWPPGDAAYLMRRRLPDQAAVSSDIDSAKE